MGKIKSRFDSTPFESQRIFDSNFNDSIQETRDLNRNLEVMVWNWILILITHYSVGSYLQLFVCLGRPVLLFQFFGRRETQAGNAGEWFYCYYYYRRFGVWRKGQPSESL